MSSAENSMGFLTLRCWLDEDGRHVWQEHDCNGQIVRCMLPFPDWRSGRAGEPTHSGPQDVTPSIHCLSCGLHAFGRIDGA